MNQYYRLTTEEPPAFFDAQPPHASYTSGHAIWMPVTSAFYPMPAYSAPNHLHYLQHHELLRMGDDAAVYDYMCAVQGDITTSLPSNIQHLPDDLYKLTQTGAAHTDTRPTEADIGGLTNESLAEMEDYIILLEEDQDAYEFAVLLDGDMENEDQVEYSLDGTMQITAGGNAMSTVEGVVRALLYREEECGMPLDCLAALERYFNSLGFQEMAYECRVQYAATHNVLWLGGDDDDYTSESEEEEEEDYAHAVPRVTIDVEEFVAKLEIIDVSAVSADDMKCFYCWDSFKETGERMITLSTGEVMAGHMPIKMPCPRGHLIGKMCLMELIDAGLDQCPVCRANIVTLVD